jgi:hypothetical protein
MRFKILVLFLAVAFLAVIFLAVYWYYENVDQPQQHVEQELKQKERQVKSGNFPDPGQHVFAKAIELLRQHDVDGAHEQLLRLTQVYHDSSRYRDARHILGEIHMDRLFSRNPMPGKRDYTIKPGDSLFRIEKASLTTIPYLNRLNNLSGTVLQPGDRIVYQPLEFEIEVDVPAKVLTLNQKVPSGQNFEFFKDYSIVDVHLPPGTARTIKTQVQEKAAFLGDKKVAPIDSRYVFARKWLQTTSRAGRIGILFRPQSEREAALESRKPDDDDLTYGIFLEDGDIEELNTIIRPGTPVSLKQ